MYVYGANSPLQTMTSFLCEAYMGLHSRDKLYNQNLFSTPIETKSILLLYRRQSAFKSDVFLNLSHLQKTSVVMEVVQMPQMLWSVFVCGFLMNIFLSLIM